MVPPPLLLRASFIPSSLSRFRLHSCQGFWWYQLLQRENSSRSCSRGLCHNHGNTGSELYLWPILQLAAMPRCSTHWINLGSNLHPHRHYVRFLVFFFFFFWLFRATPEAYGISQARGLGVESELQLPAYTTATATMDLWPNKLGQGLNPYAHGYQLDSFLLCHHRNSLCQMLNPLSHNGNSY